TECVIARAVLLEVVQSLNRFRNGRYMTLRDPPHDEVRSLHPLEPFLFASVEPLMHGLPYETLERLDVFPHRHVEVHAGIIERMDIHGVPGIVLEPPHEAFRTLREAVHQRQIVHEIRHARIIDGITNPSDIELRQIELRRVLHRCHSAATCTGSGCGLAADWSIRRSISRRQWRRNPWTGHAAPSPKAQMVCPSICFVPSNSMSISRLCARPSAMRVSTRHIQPMPSRHGVHWPQLSCL